MKFFTGRYYLYVFVILMIAYTGARIFLVDITNDEAYSFHNVKRFWYSEFLCTGNSHWLNSAWMWFCVKAGLEEVYQLRILSFLSLIVFSIFGIKILSFFRRPEIKFFGACLLFLNPFLLDYFVLARGYASASAFELLALYFFYQSLYSEKDKPVLTALLFACLAAISHFSFSYFFIAFCAVYFFHYYLRERKIILRLACFFRDSLLVISTALLVFFAIRFISRCSNDYVGAGSGHLSDMCRSVADMFLYRKSGPVTLPAFLMGVFIILIGLTSALYGTMAYRRHDNSVFYYSGLMLLIVVIVVMTARLVNGIYPEGRSLLFIYPLFAINVVCLFNSLAVKNKFISFLVALILLINFAYRMNFSFAVDFREQSNNRKVFALLEKKGVKKVIMSGEIFGVFANYYSLQSTRPFSFDGVLYLSTISQFIITGKTAVVFYSPLSFPHQETQFSKRVSYYTSESNGLIVYVLN